MIKISYHSGIYTLRSKQLIKTDEEAAWRFFSNPVNLSNITPPHMGFFITSEFSNKMYAGQIITYRINILPGIKSNWVTEITHVKNKSLFVDEQRFGPYSMWHHEHHFEETNDGILMKDIISYKIPFGIIGRMAHFIFIKHQLRKIFDFRAKKIEEIFNQKHANVKLPQAS